jgi:PKD repeat protein
MKIDAKRLFFYVSFFSVFFFTLQSCQKPTKACFVYTIGTITSNAPVVFDPSCSEMTGHFTWNFGDGTPDTTSYEAVVHNYQNPGTYTVTLNVIRKDFLVVPPRGSDYDFSTTIRVE